MVVEKQAINKTGFVKEN